MPSPAFGSFYGSHFHLPPSPFPSLSPLSLFLLDASRKRKFMEVVPRAVFPASVPVGARSWLGSALPSLCSAPQLLHLAQKIDHVTLHLLPPGHPAPGAGECILERARYMQLPAPPLKDKIPFPHSHPGKKVNFKLFFSPRRKSK